MRGKTCAICEKSFQPCKQVGTRKYSTICRYCGGVSQFRFQVNVKTKYSTNDHLNDVLNSPVLSFSERVSETFDLINGGGLNVDDFNIKQKREAKRMAIRNEPFGFSEQLE